MIPVVVVVADVVSRLDLLRRSSRDGCSVHSTSCLWNVFNWDKHEHNKWEIEKKVGI